MADRLDASSDDISAMFGIEFDASADLAQAQPAVGRMLCSKCTGTGKFRGWSGRIVGPCRACDGTGIERAMRTVAGDCPKCAGTGQWSPGRQCFACVGTGKASASRDASTDASKISAAFAAAHAHGIKRPKLRLDTFQFSRAPDTGRNAGAIYVTQDGAYLGKIADGRFQPVRECDDPTRDRVAAVASDPHAAAKAFGQRTGRCSCCGAELTNAESIALRIGPICREKYGWA